MIYVDASVALAHLLTEDRRPPEALWSETLVASRLLEFEVWTRIHAQDIGASHAEEVRDLLGKFAFVEMISEILGRARLPYPVRLRTLDALHLASLHFIASQGQQIALASYDERMLAAARAMDVAIHPLD